MIRSMFALAVLALGTFLSTALADCPTPPLAPTPPTPLLFCDNFNTYCGSPDGGFPGGAGDPADPDCASNGNPDNARMRSVWFKTSKDEFNDTACGEDILVDPAHDISTTPANMGPISDDGNPENYQVLSSSPFAARIPGRGTLGEVPDPNGGAPIGGQLLAQHTLKDWVAPNALGLSRLIGNAFGNQYSAVAATDANPLVVSFFISGKAGPSGNPGFAGRIWYSDGYVELAYGDESYMNRANTDYGATPYFSCCSPAISQGPFPFMCAVGLPIDPVDLTRCPPAATAPVHNAIAIGALPMVDASPCNCGTAHGGTAEHPSLYDGKLWYNVRQNNPVTSTGNVQLLNGTVTPWRAGLDLPGRFVFYGGKASTNTHSFKDSNWIILTIRTSTMKLEMRSRELYDDSTEYYVNSVMDNIPRQYLGPFDRIRLGVGPGCELASNSSWTACAGGTARHCIDNNTNQAYHVDIDDLSVSGGVGFTQIGACCHPNGTCSEELPENCPAPSTHAGPNTLCATSSCCAHDTFVWADADGDGDVDPTDFAKFQLCYTGPGGPMPADPKCKCFNREGNDNDVDGSDYNEFVKCETGATIPWTPALTPTCTP